jgi:hypothetical protein
MASVATLAASIVAGSTVGIVSAGAASQTKVPKLVLPASLKGPAPSAVKIGLAGGYSINFLPAIVAMGAGYLNTVGQRFHTTFSFDIYGGGSTAEPAFLGGTDQLMVIGTASYFSAVQAGKDQFSLFNEEGPQLGIIFSGPQKYKTTRGTNVSAYGGAGNTWCQISPVGSSHTAAVLVSSANHINLQNQNLTTIGSVAAVLPSLASGQCAIVSGDANSAANGVIQSSAYAVDNTEGPDNTIPIAGEQVGIPVTTSHAFVKQYPKLAQAITDALLQSLLLIQTNVGNANYLYSLLPPDMQNTLALGSFAQVTSFFGSAFNPKYDNGTFPLQELNDTVALAQGTSTIPPTSNLDLSNSFANTYVIQAWKDLGKTITTGPQNGPAKLPTVQGKPSLEAATAVSEITNQPVASNTGPSPMGQIATTTTTAAASSTSTTS